MDDTWNIKTKLKQNYCKDLILKIPVIQKNKTLHKKVSTICKELYNINHFLINVYDDIFHNGLIILGHKFSNRTFNNRY